MSATIEKIWETLEPLTDPEIPVVTLRELGVLRDVRESGNGFEVVITPTYSGCPAMGQIEDDIRASLERAGISASVVTQLSPAWTTDWMSEEAKEKLRQYGIAPPHRTATQENVVRFVSNRSSESIACPHCGSKNTTLTSQFGSTACKALYKCLDCSEPFDYFKPF